MLVREEEREMEGKGEVEKDKIDQPLACNHRRISAGRASHATPEVK